MSNHDTVIGTAGGTLLTCLGMVVKVLPVEKVYEVIIVASLGAVASFLATKLCKYLWALAVAWIKSRVR